MSKKSGGLREQTAAAAIEAVLHEHEPVWATSIDMLVRCDCGYGHDLAGYDQDGHNAHVAAAVSLALGLTEERKDIIDPHWTDWNNKPLRTERRWVSGWSEGSA